MTSTSVTGIGELVTCSRCIGTWVAAGLTATQMVAPRLGRMVTWSLAAAGASSAAATRTRSEMRMVTSSG